ncbi:IS630 family transposase [Psychrosphaera algicola]|uniref:IS630 family transposase n=1 Tax=Psychrosphaera algicola TaxID=3023714 RepID=A0ABT5FGF9_9GAMM|nr:IS630 family transposase [Psychrosphaera sp. G1-22]MDC2890162.1 IS630 family transposase [Psychrosphaera sp. G1-22]
MKVNSKNDVLALAKAEQNARKKLRLLAVYHFLDGKNRTQIASMLVVSRRIVNEWIKRYLSFGLDGLESKKQKGREPYLNEIQKLKLAKFVEKQSVSATGGRLTGERIHRYIVDNFGVTYHPNSVYKLLESLGYSWITSRSKHPKQSQNNQETFKKVHPETILNTPFNVMPKDMDIWFQDEARFGQQNTTTRVWAKKGTRPRAVKQQQFEYAYLFGAVCPRNGRTEALITPYVNKEVMTLHMEQISKATPIGRHAVVIMDGAGWHTLDTVQPFDNVTLIKLPPYSPELNPIEQVWSWMRQHHLANKSFKGYDDIVNSCTKAWNCFISDTKRVIKMCTRAWASVGTN